MRERDVVASKVVALILGELHLFRHDVLRILILRLPDWSEVGWERKAFHSRLVKNDLLVLRSAAW